MLKVVSFTICPFVQRVTALLEAKGLPYQVEYIRLSDKPQWFVELSPLGQVPLLITEAGIPLFESDAIVEYLQDRYPDVADRQDPETRARERAWSYLASKHYLTQCGAQRSADKATLDERSDKLNRAFATMEQVLAQRSQPQRFFGGDQVGRVDIAWLPLLHRAALVERHSGYDFVDGYPQLKQWQQQLLETGLADRSVAADFETAFGDFYLSEQTWLGRLGQDCLPCDKRLAANDLDRGQDQERASGSCC